MTKITKDTVKDMARLGGLELTDDETDKFTADIERTLGYIDQLAELETDSIEPTYQVTGLTNVWRDDEVEAILPKEELLRCAGENVAKAQVKVPKVL